MNKHYPIAFKPKADMIPSNFKCVPIDGQEFESEKSGLFDTVLFNEFYLIDASGNAFKSKSDLWLVSKFIEVGNDIFSVGNLRSYKTYDDAWAATYKTYDNA